MSRICRVDLILFGEDSFIWQSQYLCGLRRDEILCFHPINVQDNRCRFGGGDEFHAIKIEKIGADDAIAESVTGSWIVFKNVAIADNCVDA